MHIPSPFRSGTLAAVLALGAPGLAIADHSRFGGLGVVPGGTAQVVAISADGAAAAGNLSSAALTPQGFRWTRATGIVRIGTFGSTQAGTSILGISGDGSTLVGFANIPPNGQAIRWTPAFNVQPIPGTIAYAASFDGSVIVGEMPTGSGRSAFRWTALTGTVPLGVLSGEADGQSGARAVSADGLTIVGYSDPFFPVPGHVEAFAWTPESLMIGLGWLPGGGTQSIANAVSPDGAAIVGVSDSSRGREAFLRTPDGILALGSLSGFPANTTALGVSDGGTVVVGTDNAGTPQPFIWTAAQGMRSLRSILQSDHGLNLAGWTLIDARGISADGRTIVGNGVNPCGHPEPWIAHLGDTPPCTADFDGDGTVTASDIFAFLAAWFSGDSSADVNQMGCVDTQDIFAFLDAWFSGCP